MIKKVLFGLLLGCCLVSPIYAREYDDYFVEYIDIIRYPEYDGDTAVVEVGFKGIPDYDSVYLTIREDRLLFPEDYYHVDPYNHWTENGRLVCVFEFEAYSGYWDFIVNWSYDGIDYEYKEEGFEVLYDADGNRNDGGGGCNAEGQSKNMILALALVALLPAWKRKFS